MSEPTFPHDELRSDRRSFLKIAGIGGAVLVAAGCDSDDPDPINPGEFANLMGTVRVAAAADAGESPVEGVLVTATSDDPGIEGSRTTTTDASGMYAFDELPAGTYTVTVGVDNFVTEDVEEEVTVSADGAATADFSLMPGGNIVFDFSSDFGVLNFAYALEQLEAAFYAAVVASPYDGISADEMEIMMDLAAHEAIHRDFFAAAITGAGGTFAAGTLLPELDVNFDAVDFADRESVLTQAQTFEDLGVGAYNGAGQYLNMSSTDESDVYLTLAGKIVSVEARHASVIAGLIAENTIAAAGVIDAEGLDQALDPNTVLTAAAPFLVFEDSIATGFAAINV